MPFFACGYFVSQYKDKLRRLSFLRWIALVAFPIFFIIGGDLNYSTPLYSWPDYTFFTRGDLVFAFYRLWMALLGIGMTFAVVDLLVRVAVMRRVLCHLGGITLGIYCAHSLWRNIGIGTGIEWISSGTLVALLLSVALIWVLQRAWVTDYLFLGGAQRLVPRKS
jgi:hypothetical protein